MTADPFSEPVEVTSPDTFTPKKTTHSWHKVVGFIGLGLGAYAVLGAAVSPFTNEMSMASMQGDLDGEALAAYEEMVASQASLLIPTGIVGTLLIIGSILLLRKKPVARPVLLGWSGLKIVLSCYVAGWTVIHMGGFMEQVVGDANNASEMPPGFGNMIQAMAYVGALMGLAFSCALPGFLLVWLNRSVIRAEIADWKQPDA